MTKKKKILSGRDSKEPLLEQMFKNIDFFVLTSELFFNSYFLISHFDERFFDFLF